MTSFRPPIPIAFKFPMRPRPSIARLDQSARVCPTCGQKYLPDESESLPFCSQRCQLVDLGRWLDEEIGVPHEGDAGEAPVEYRDHPDDES